MAVSPIPITPGAGALVDARTVGSSYHRQAMVIGDPDTDTEVAEVVGGGLRIRPMPASSSAVTAVTAAVATTTLLAANANRLGAFVYNDTAGTLYVKLGTGAVLSDFSFPLPGGAVYELPTWSSIYTGIITGFFMQTSGVARVTELT